mmetsp:Transcript_612/g.962  ORF Transcript_612/g.962 Transcript_612/m.962 type:complete len:223 (-) Transcript_612:80-748(-)
MVEYWIQLCGQLAPMVAIAVFMAPIPTIFQVWKDKKVGDLPLLPYTSIILNGFVWVSYGIMKEEPKVWIPNSTGLALGIIYFLIFISYAPTKSPTLPGSVLQHMQGASLVILTCLGLAFFSGTTMVGNLGVVICVCMFASPLAALKVVIQTKSARAIPLPFSMVSVMNCFFWSVSGLFEMHDYAIYVPNLLGLFFSLVQVFLKLTYGNGVGSDMIPLSKEVV